MEDYYAALKRLINGNTKFVPKGSRITNDNVSLEAGRKKGSIKKSRGQFTQLIAAIDAAAIEQLQTPERLHIEEVSNLKKSITDYKLLYEAAIAREVSLAAELFELKRIVAKLTGENVIPLRKSSDGQRKKPI